MGNWRDFLNIPIKALKSLMTIYFYYNMNNVVICLESDLLTITNQNILYI